MHKKDILPFTETEEKIVKKVIEQRDKTRDKYHLVYALGATFGFVSVLYGFEKLIDRVDLFVNHPWILLIIGILILGITGTIYKKLD